MLPNSRRGPFHMARNLVVALLLTEKLCQQGAVLCGPGSNGWRGIASLPRFRIGLIGTHFPKFGRPLEESALALLPLFLGYVRIDKRLDLRFGDRLGLGGTFMGALLRSSHYQKFSGRDPAAPVCDQLLGHRHALVKPLASWHPRWRRSSLRRDLASQVLHSLSLLTPAGGPRFLGRAARVPQPNRPVRDRGSDHGPNWPRPATIA